MAIYAAAAGGLLAFRLRAEYRGENFGEAPVPGKTRGADGRARSPRNTRGTAAVNRRWLDGPVGAVLAKEAKILSRSGVMLFGLFTPLVLIFAMGGPVRTDPSFSLQYAFPVAIAYGFLPLTRQFCNSLGTEGAGIQLYFLSPTPFRSVMLAKNLLQTGLFCMELALVATVAVYRFGVPNLRLAIATFCWVLFALPANLAVGNVLSITLAYRMTLTRLSREQGSVGNGLLSLLIQLLLFAVGVAAYVPLALTHHVGLAAPVFLVLAAASVFVWLRVPTRECWPNGGRAARGADGNSGAAGLDPPARTKIVYAWMGRDKPPSLDFRGGLSVSAPLFFGVAVSIMLLSCCAAVPHLVVAAPRSDRHTRFAWTAGFQGKCTDGRCGCGGDRQEWPARRRVAQGRLCRGGG